MDINNINEDQLTSLLSQSELVSIAIECKNEFYQPDILIKLQLKDKIVINNYDCYYLAIRFFDFKQIEISFYEDLFEIDNINDKGRFQISTTTNSEWQDCFTINEHLLYPDSEYIIKDVNFICIIVNNINKYITQAMDLYKQFFILLKPVKEKNIF